MNNGKNTCHSNNEPKTYLWLEDRKGKASFTFWQELMRQIAPDVVVESKKNNSELVKAVRDLTDDTNRYIIMFDYSFDNLQVYQEQKLLTKYTNKKPNVKLLYLICFEYMLLEFTHLLSWIYAPNDEFWEKRKFAIKARRALIDTIQSGDTDYKALREIIQYDKALANHNIEQLSAKLLFDLTRNTGFAVSKKSIGQCWITSCCDWKGREADDLCGLDENRLTVKEKMQRVYLGTSLKTEFDRIGMEVS